MVLDELLDEAPVTWARSYGGPLLPPMILREPIPDFPRDIPANGTEEEGREEDEEGVGGVGLGGGGEWRLEFDF